MMKHILLLCVLVSIEKIITFMVGWIQANMNYQLEFFMFRLLFLVKLKILCYYHVILSFIFQVSSALSNAIKEAQVGIDCPMQVFLTSYFLT